MVWCGVRGLVVHYSDRPQACSRSDQSNKYTKHRESLVIHSPIRMTHATKEERVRKHKK